MIAGALRRGESGNNSTQIGKRSEGERIILKQMVLSGTVDAMAAAGVCRAGETSARAAAPLAGLSEVERQLMKPRRATMPQHNRGTSNAVMGVYAILCWPTPQELEASLRALS